MTKVLLIYDILMCCKLFFVVALLNILQLYFVIVFLFIINKTFVIKTEILHMGANKAFFVNLILTR